MSEYRVTVIRTTRYMVLAETAEEAERRVREDSDILDAIESGTEVLVEPFTLAPTPVPETVAVGREDDAAGAGTTQD